MDKNYEIRERQISFSQLWWKFLQSWRFVLTCILLFAVLFTAVRYRKDVRNLQYADTESELSVDDVLSLLSEEEIEEAERVAAIRQRLTERENYYRESTLMDMDPYHINMVSLQYYVDVDYHVNLSQDISKDVTKDIVGAYCSYISNIGDMTDTDSVERYEAELLSTSTVESTGIFTVYVMGEDMNGAEELADRVKEVMESYQGVLSEKIAAHELVLLNRSAAITINSELSSKQAEVRNAIYELETALNEQAALLSSQQLLIVDQMFGETNEENMEPADHPAVKINVKYTVFGGCIGLFLAFLGIMLQYILGKSIKYADEISDIYGLPVIGELKSDKGKSKVFGAVDLWLEKKKYRGILTPEEQWNLMMTNLSVTCKKQSLERIFITTSRNMDEKDRKLIDRMLEDLRDKNIIAGFGEDANRNAETFERMSESANVVLIEKINCSAYSDVEKEVLLCREQELNILGVIVVE